MLLKSFKKMISNIKQLPIGMTTDKIISLTFFAITGNIFVLLRLEFIRRTINELAGDVDKNNLLLWMGLFIMSCFLSMAVGHLEIRYLGKYKRNAFKSLSEEIITKNSLLLSWRNASIPTAQRLSIAGKDTDELIAATYGSLPQFLAWSITIPIYFIYTMRISPIMAIAVITIEIIVLIVSNGIQSDLPALNADRRKNYSKWYGFLQRTLENIEIMKVGINPTQHKRILTDYAFTWNRSSIISLRTLLRVDQVQRAGGLLLEIGTIITGVILWMLRILFPGDIYAMLISVQTLRDTLEGIPDMIEFTHETNAYIERVNSLLNLECTHVEGINPGPFEEPLNTLSIKNLTYSYDDENTAINNLTYTFEKGKFYAIVGGSGSGKSTLLLLLAKLLDTSTCDIFYNDNKYEDIHRDSLWDRVAYTGIPCFIPGGYVENVLFGRPYDRLKFESSVNMREERPLIEKDKAEGSWIHVDGYPLSAGERQRLILYRMFYRKPEVMLLDEPFANIDIQREGELMSKIKEKVRDTACCTIMATHRLEYLHICDEILVMNEGSLLASGTYSDLYSECSHFRNLIKTDKLEIRGGVDVC